MEYDDRLAPKVRVEAAIALALGSALIGATASRVVFPGVPASAVVLSAMLGLLGLSAGSRPHRPHEDSGIEWLAVFGMLVSVPATVALAHPGGVCLALFLAPPAGLALAALWWSLLAGLRDLQETQVAEDVDVAQEISGRWLALIGGVTAPTAILATDPILAGGAIAVALLGGLRAASASRARRRRRRWLARVATGEVPGLRIVPADAFASEQLTGLPSLLRATRDDGVLVEVASEGPYRESGLGAPRARVPRTFDDELGGGVPWAPLRGALAIVGALLAPLMSLLLSAGAAEILTREAGPCAAGADLLCGWLLLLSGPSTGAALLVLSHLHRPARATVWWLGVSIYLLACPFVCLLVSFASRLACM
jgi:hypothetical protein